jgi:23S rRNA (uracil1939-C5)-methyltransferase
VTATELDGLDAVVIDPPRAGASAQVKELAASNVAKIIYVSCNPQTFAKDAAHLIGGGYEFQKLTIVDQFIWSAHVELVGIFQKTR